MQKIKRGVKARKLMAEKERISNIAKWILVAFCLQFVFYLFLINIVPVNNEVTGERNGLYSELWYNYKGSQGDIHTEGNGIKFIYFYNMILLGCMVVLLFYYFMVFLDENEGHVMQAIKRFFKKNLGLLFLASFMVWTFISSCFAYDPFRSFVGCYNLRDGYFSFMFYGSVLVCILLMSLSEYEGKIRKLFNEIEIDPRRLIVDIFIVVMTIVAVITIGDYYELNYGETQGMVIQYADGTTDGQGMGISVEPKYTMKMTGSNGEAVRAVLPYSSAGTITSSVFNNSNHYAYILAIAVVVAATMLIKAKGLIKMWYALSFSILTVMLIINNTFGGYLGVMISLVLIFIHSAVMFIYTFYTNKEINLDIIFVMIIATIFVSCSIFCVNTEGDSFVNENFAYIGQSIDAILNDTKIIEENTEEGKTESGEREESGENEESGGSKESGESVESGNSTNTNQLEAGDAGSGRWKLWVGAWEIITSNYRHVEKYIENGDEKIVVGEKNIYVEKGDKKNIIKNKEMHLESVDENVVIGDKEIYVQSGDEKIVITDKEIYTESGDERNVIKTKKIGNITIKKRIRVDGMSDRIKDSLFGDGLENFIYEYSNIGIGEGRSHNLILQLAGTVGVPGMILYVLGVACIFFQSLKYFKVWDTYTYMGIFVMVSYLITALTGNSGFYTSGYFYIFVGFVVVGTITLSKQKEQKDINNLVQVRKMKGKQ